MHRTTILLSLLLTVACRPAPSPQPAPAVERLPDAVHWVRNSAEHEAVFHQVFRAAGAALRERAAGRAAGTWATVLDADETTIDNSTFEVEAAQDEAPFDEGRWNAWVRRRAATVLPGAAEYVRQARALGGRVIIVTNRDDAVCDATRDNLLAVGIVADLVLCKPEGESDKNPRFARIAAGTASPDLPPLEVLVWVGDNIRDFPGLTQELRFAPDSAFAQFGRSWFVLPNPMYGSWEQNPAD